MEIVGQTLGGRYRVVREIGKGGMGGVYEAIDTASGAGVAIKTIADQFSSDPHYLERFRREAWRS